MSKIKGELNNPKNTKQEQSTVERDNVKSSDTVTFLEEIKQYTDERNNNQRVTQDHTRATFLIDNESLSELDDLVDYMEALGAVDGGDLVKVKGIGKDLDKYRVISKNFKSRFINFCIKEGLKAWKDKEDEIPDIDRARFPVGDDEYWRAFKIKDQHDHVYYTEQDNRGHQKAYLTTNPEEKRTDKQATEEYINELFEKKQKLEQSDLEQKAQQRKQKKEDKERERMRMILQELNNE